MRETRTGTAMRFETAQASVSAKTEKNRPFVGQHEKCRRQKPPTADDTPATQRRRVKNGPSLPTAGGVPLAPETPAKGSAETARFRKLYAVAATVSAAGDAARWDKHAI